MFEENKTIQQMFVCSEKQVLFEIPTTNFVDGILLLMASYYVFDVQYPSCCKSTLFFFQDVLMDKPDKEKRATRYSTFIANNNCDLEYEKVTSPQINHFEICNKIVKKLKARRIPFFLLNIFRGMLPFI